MRIKIKKRIKKKDELLTELKTIWIPLLEAAERLNEETNEGMHNYSHKPFANLATACLSARDILEEKAND